MVIRISLAWPRPAAYPGCVYGDGRMQDSPGFSSAPGPLVAPAPAPGSRPAAAGIPRATCLVVGAGIVGTLSALRLLQQGHAVCLVDSDFEALCCSTGNAGSVSAGSVVPLGMPGMWKQVPRWLIDPDGPLSIRPEYAGRIAPWLLRFLRASTPDRVARIAPALHALNAPSIALYRELADVLGASTLFQATGQLQVYTSGQARQKDAGGWRLRQAHGVAMQPLDRADIQALEPAVGPQYTHGMFLPDEGMVTDPRGLLQRLRRAVVEAGGELLQARVQGLQPQGDQTVRVETTHGSRTVQHVVVAAGAWSHRLAAQLGDRVPLQPQRGYHVVFEDSGVALKRPVVAAEAKCFATPMDMGLRVAGTVEFGSLDAPPNPRRTQALLKHSQALFPGLRLGDAATRSTWMGCRPCLPDSLPVIGPSQAGARVIYAFGHGHLGLTQAPMTARVVADLVAGRSPAIDIQPYRAARFGAGG